MLTKGFSNVARKLLSANKIKYLLGKNLKKLAIAIAALALAGSASADFVNGGFETGDFTGWIVGGSNGGRGVALDGTPVLGGAFEPAFVNARSGKYAAFGLTAGSSLEFLSLSQTVNVAAGLQTVGFYLGHDEPSVIGIQGGYYNSTLAIFIDGVKTPFTQEFRGSNFSYGSTPSDMFLFATDFMSLGKAVNFELRISGSGSSRTVLSIDDAFVTGGTTTVPEPGSLAMVGVGLLGLVAARRRAT